MATKKQEHEALAAHHVSMAEHHDKAAGHHGELAAHFESTENPEAAAAHEKLQECHKALATEHTAEGERHIACCKASDDSLEKAGDGELAETLRDLKKFLSDVVRPMPTGLSAIPRHGAPSAKDISDARKSVDPVLKAAILPEDPQDAPSNVAWGQRAAQ
jgi:hypothetical protein